MGHAAGHGAGPGLRGSRGNGGGGMSQRQAKKYARRLWLRAKDHKNTGLVYAEYKELICLDAWYVNYNLEASDAWILVGFFSSAFILGTVIYIFN